ncbi:protein SUPPRESSOR OF GENE SILENCING 3-like [Nicotiana tabacum]|uniref:Protein SUPPRESSOR OF GENE SILENCING 3-like n=1 Tax=Nicotiana tabacum TaxID=4097 RepID=A0AC58TN78_TOBAC
MEALRLSEQFSEKGRDRDAWEHNPDLFYPRGKRKLYSYMAKKRGMDNFNRHSHGKSRLKFEIRSYQETIGNPAMQMSEDNQQLLWFKNVQTSKHQKRAKASETSLRLVSEKHRQTIEENKIVILRTKMHQVRNKEEMEYLEKF